MKHIIITTAAVVESTSARGIPIYSCYHPRSRAVFVSIERVKTIEPASPHAYGPNTTVSAGQPRRPVYATIAALSYFKVLPSQLFNLILAFFSHQHIARRSSLSYTHTDQKAALADKLTGRGGLDRRID